jgi:hypothetical protein
VHLLLIQSRDEVIVVENRQQTSPDLEARGHQVLILSRSCLVAIISDIVKARLNDHIN